MPFWLEVELLGRLLLAVLLGGVLGFERQMGQHPAGLRTHILVSLGAAAFTVAGTYGVAGLGTTQDPGRVAAQIVTGVGFLGAGTIWRSNVGNDRAVIYGLTTAASIWVAASIGMLCGFGLYILAAGSAVFGLMVLRLFKGLENMRFPSRRPASRATTAASVPPALPAGAAAPSAGVLRPPGSTRRPVEHVARNGTAAHIPEATPMAAATEEAPREDGGVPRDTLPEYPPPGAQGAQVKRKRLRKKDRKRKGKRRDTATDDLDQFISDAPRT
ncbi:MAG: MgtC/SapB family protein [Chloroflexota bacterium]